MKENKIDTSKFDIRISNIESEAVFDNDGENDYRYLLKRIWDDKYKDMASVILFNPSYADEYLYDYTSMKVINFLIKEKKYKGVYILNLYPIIKPKRKNVIKEFKLINQEQNDFYIKKAIKESKDIYIGWGTHKSNKTRIREIISMLEKNNHKKVYELTDKEENAKHPSRMTIDSCLEKDLDQLRKDIDKIN